MTQLTITPAVGDPKDRDNYQPESGILADGVLVYTYLRTGDLKFGKTDEYHFTTSVVVDKKTAKAWKKAYPKNTPKEIETEEFEAKYKIPPPFPDEDEQWILRFSANTVLSVDLPDAGLSKGDDVPYEWASRPKAVIKGDEGLTDVTFNDDYAIGNGTKASISFVATESDFGKFPKFRLVLITDLVKYEKSESKSASATSTAFGEIVGGFNGPAVAEAIGGTEEAEAPAAETPAKEAPAESGTPEDPFA